MSYSAILPPGFSCAEDELTSALLDPPGAPCSAKLLAARYGEFALVIALFGAPDNEFKAGVWRP